MTNLMVTSQNFANAPIKLSILHDLPSKYVTKFKCLKNNLYRITATHIPLLIIGELLRTETRSEHTSQQKYISDYIWSQDRQIHIHVKY